MGTLLACMFVHQKPEECVRSFGVELQKLWTTTWMLGTEPRSSAKSRSALNPGVISPPTWLSLQWLTRAALRCPSIISAADARQMFTASAGLGYCLNKRKWLPFSLWVLPQMEKTEWGLSPDRSKCGGPGLEPGGRWPASKRFQVQSPMQHTHSLHTLGGSFVSWLGCIS